MGREYTETLSGFHETKIIFIPSPRYFLPLSLSYSQGCSLEFSGSSTMCDIAAE
jgi:hypothetical protein